MGFAKRHLWRSDSAKSGCSAIRYQGKAVQAQRMMISDHHQKIRAGNESLSREAWAVSVSTRPVAVFLYMCVFSLVFRAHRWSLSRLASCFPHDAQFAPFRVLSGASAGLRG